MIEVSTLGDRSVRREGIEIAGLSKDRQRFTLLVYLALQGPVSRRQLVTVMWPETEPEHGQHLLSQTIASLDEELGGSIVIARKDELGLAPDTVRLDVAELERAAEDGRWETVAELHHGDFLEVFELPGGSRLAHWRTQTRSRLDHLARQAFTQLILVHLESKDLSASLATAWRWASLQPLDAAAHHALITLLAHSGDRDAALQQYEAYRKRLATLEGSEPDSQIAGLAESIRAGDTPDFSQFRTQVSDSDLAVRETTAAAYGLSDVGPSASAVSRDPQGGSIIRALRDRRVFHVAAGYLAVSWLTIEFSAVLIERGILSDAVFPVLLFLLAVGLPLTLVVAWVVEDRQARPVSLDTEGRHWSRNIRAAHVLAVLGVLIISLLAGRFLLERGATLSQPSELAAAIDPASIAVLYFDDLSGEGGLEHIAAGFTAGLISQLAQIEPLTVISRNWVKPYRNSDISLDSIARALKVAWFVEGSVARSGDGLRVGVELVDAASGVAAWSQTLQRPRGEILDLRDELLEELSDVLRQQLGIELGRRQRRAGTSSAQAWELLQQAEAQIDDHERLTALGEHEGAPGMLSRADSLLMAAEALDPGWIEPIVLRGWTAQHQARLASQIPGLLDEGWLSDAIGHAERAISLDPRDPSALELRGTLRFELWRVASDSTRASDLFEGAERDLRAAVLEDPSRANAWTTLSVFPHEAKVELAEASFAARRALEADPFLLQGSNLFLLDQRSEDGIE